MTRIAFRPGFVLVIAATVLLSLTRLGEAAQRTPNTLPERRVAVEQGPAPAPQIVSESDAEQTREKLNELLGKYPPSLGRVLKLDPSLMSNDAYVAPYPALATFLAQHPEVAHNPSYFLERVSVSQSYGPSDPQEQRRRHMESLVGDFTAFMVFLVVMAVLIWLIRMVVDSRRWSRLSKVQFDVHTKLLDRFASSEELMAYIQTPAGRKFLESAPIQLHDEVRPLGAPLSRILISLQAGIVLAIAGIGVLLVSAEFTDEPAQFFFVVGVVTLALGAGFIVSAAAAYVLSRKLGLLERPAPDHA